jgi:DNA-binding MarR family transcriptional regulator
MPDKDLLDTLHALMHQFKRHMHDALRATDGGVGPMESRVLGYVARHPGHSATDLVAHSGRDKAQITRLVQQLVDRGWLLREPDPADGRRHRLALSASGRSVQRLMQQQRQRFASRMTADLSAAEQQLLQALLLRVLAAGEAAQSK